LRRYVVSTNAVEVLEPCLDHAAEVPSSPTAADDTPRHDPVLRQVLRGDGGGPRIPAVDAGRGADSAGLRRGGTAAAETDCASLHVDADGRSENGGGDLPGKDRESERDDDDRILRASLALMWL